MVLLLDCSMNMSCDHFIPICERNTVNSVCVCLSQCCKSKTQILKVTLWLAVGRLQFLSLKHLLTCIMLDVS